MEILDELKVPTRTKDGNEINRYWLQHENKSDLNIFILRSENPIARFLIFVGVLAGPFLVYLGVVHMIDVERFSSFTVPILGLILIVTAIRQVFALKNSKTVYTFDQNQISLFLGGKCIEHFSTKDVTRVFVRGTLGPKGKEYWISIETNDDKVKDLLLMTKGKEAVDIIDGVPVLKSEADLICNEINLSIGGHDEPSES